uniref:Ankyrin repeat domain 53 n=1 Tax=Microcebus murinus TaxID=30608 RepID=A0A8C5WAK8_MICMU
MASGRRPSLWTAASSWELGAGALRAVHARPTSRTFVRRLETISSKATCSDAGPSSTDQRDQRAFGTYYELFAAAVGNVEWLRFCLGRDRKGGFTAIHFAAQRGKLACLQILIEEYNFPVDLPTNNNQTPLHLVIHKDNKTMALPCISYLLKKGAALNVFLKDAMWKRDKSDFAREMGKMKRLKDQLVFMERSYLIECQSQGYTLHFSFPPHLALICLFPIKPETLLWQDMSSLSD